MNHNVIPEYISLIFVFIIVIYSKERNMIPTLKNRIYSLTSLTVIVSILFSILTSIIIKDHYEYSNFIRFSITAIYYLITPLIALMYFLYTLAIIDEYHPKVFVYIKISTIPYLLYFLLVLFKTDTIFYFNNNGYNRGSFFYVVYVISILYLIFILLLTIFNRKNIDRSLKYTLISFPTIAIVGVLGQIIFPNYIFSGTAATSSLLIIYLYLQNKKIVVDDITGLTNFNGFSKMLELNIKKKKAMDIILIDLNDFKYVNKKFGKYTGDKFLRIISDYLKSISPKRGLYRYGGDKFVIILDNKTNDNSILNIIENRFRNIWSYQDIEYNLTANISVIKHPNDVNTVEDIINLLDYCNIISKKSGAGKTIFSNDIINKSVKRRNDIINILKQGLINTDIFQVHYQPIYSIKKNKFTSAESLLRIYDDSLGVISPVEFIPIAEETGLIIEIGYIVLDKVCKYLKLLEENNINIDGISVNFSPLQLAQKDLIVRIMDIIEKNEVKINKIRIEVTESILMGNYEEIKNIMDSLSQKGIRFYLDDFGTEYSNVARLIELPFEYIKLDKSLLYNSCTNYRCFSIVSALSSAFCDVGMKVLVEGVENKNHLELIDKIKVDYLQGFFYAKPMNENEASKYIKMNYIEA